MQNRHGADATYFDVKMLRAYRVFAKQAALGGIRVEPKESDARWLEANLATIIHACGMASFFAPNCVVASVNLG